LKTNSKNAAKPFNLDQFEEILIDFSKSIHNHFSEDEILWDLAKNCVAKLGFVDCVVYLVDTKNKLLLQKAAFGPKNPKNTEIYHPTLIPLGKGISGFVAASGIAEIVADTSKDGRYIVDDENRLSEISVPIKVNNQVLGVIDCEHPEKNYFTQQHLRMLSAVASLCAIKIHSLRTEKKVKTEKEKTLLFREEMVQLKLKAFRSQMNPHFIFNALNAIQYFITSENKRSAVIYLSVFSKLIRFYLKYIEKETVSLTEEFSMLQGYLKLQKLRYHDQFEYVMTIDEKVKHNEAVIPSFILQTLFENIIEHAIYNQYKNFNINIIFKAIQKQVLVDIQFNCDSTPNEKIKYTPEYRDNL
jgi:Putative regulator of cell autolysis